MDDELVRGELPQRLTELLLAQAEVARAAVMWSTGEVYAPLTQLQDLGQRLNRVCDAAAAVRAEVVAVYRATRDQQARVGEPPAAMLGRWSDTA